MARPPSERVVALRCEHRPAVAAAGDALGGRPMTAQKLLSGPRWDQTCGRRIKHR
jgi:hypothetical protein